MKKYISLFIDEYELYESDCLLKWNYKIFNALINAIHYFL